MRANAHAPKVKPAKSSFGMVRNPSRVIIWLGIADGTILFTDGAKAYEKLAKEKGWVHAYVDHEEGEFSRDQRIRGKVRKVSTQYIDGVWGNFKTWYNARHGAYKDHVWSVVKEWQWRHNHRGEDLFMVLLKDFKDGYYR